MLAHLLATWFGCGHVPKAPGTAGAAGALIPAILLWQYLEAPPWWFALLAAAATPIGIWAAGSVARARSLKDPQIVVIDEVLGVWVALAGATVLNWTSLLAAFALFRLFDIWKPQPVRKLESLGGGVGIVADDLMAGVYAALVLFAAGCFNLY
ncbi:MAG: phosphatidylglycerophosphatase A [Bryobacteraceae bacterium]|nr:phosphatidylglycerophosphatase A [Bryobacteraceae bacterium]